MRITFAWFHFHIVDLCVPLSACSVTMFLQPGSYSRCKYGHPLMLVLFALVFSFTEELLWCPLKPGSRLTYLVILSPSQLKRRLIKASPQGVKPGSIWSFSACWSTGRPLTWPAMIRAEGKVENYSHLVEAANREMSGICLHVPPKALRWETGR